MVMLKCYRGLSKGSMLLSQRSGSGDDDDDGNVKRKEDKGELKCKGCQVDWRAVNRKLTNCFEFNCTNLRMQQQPGPSFPIVGSKENTLSTNC